MNTALKHLGERALIVSGVARLAGFRLRQRTVVLAYHNVAPSAAALSGNLNLHLPQREFARHLDVLVRTHDVVPIDALQTSQSATGRPRAIITFDDAYAGSLTAGVDELVRRGLPATIFVAPALLGSTPWWDVLAERTSGVIPGDLQRYTLETLGGQTAEIFRWMQPGPAESTVTSSLPRIATEADLRVAASRPGITIGSHTWSHPNLCALKPAELETELARPLEWLESRFPGASRWLTYPYGYFNHDVQLLAAKIGYLGAFRIDGGWVPQSPVPSYAIPRLNIPFGLSLNGFRLRLAGLL